MIFNKIILLLFFVCILSYGIGTKACSLTEKQLRIVNINVIKDHREKNNLDIFKLHYKKIQPLGWVYVFDEYNYTYETLNILGKKKTFHYFEDELYELLLTEHTLSTEGYFRKHQEKEMNSLEIISEAIKKLASNDFDKCSELAFHYYLSYTNYFPNQSAKKIDFYLDEKSIFAIYDNDYTSVQFLTISSMKPNKLIKGSVTNKLNNMN
ncbi:hypothetical protein [Colwellia polaris]|uniref:hypothetical protein n=1 Tax=Colwellia polaris TaxID=326537 RepID=UPI000A1734BF|nr:hypothetical protein [Colwellia polaris]